MTITTHQAREADSRYELLSFLHSPDTLAIDLRVHESDCKRGLDENRAMFWTHPEYRPDQTDLLHARRG